jgi:hypothetical protein
MRVNIIEWVAQREAHPGRSYRSTKNDLIVVRRPKAVDRGITPRPV